MNKIYKTMITGALALPLILTGYNGVNAEEPKPEKTYFEDWGFVDNLKLHFRTDHNGSINDDLEIMLGDMDGDGDLDIVVGSKAGLKIYENRIPQKSSKK